MSLLLLLLLFVRWPDVWVLGLGLCLLGLLGWWGFASWGLCCFYGGCVMVALHEAMRGVCVALALSALVGLLISCSGGAL